MSWFEEVADYLKANLESYARHYFSGSKKIKPDGKGYAIEPCPYCTKEDCFKVRYEGFVKCFSCNVTYEGRQPSLINAVRLLEGDNYIRSLEEFTGIKMDVKPMTPEKQKAYDEKKRTEEIHEYAIEFYHRELMGHEKALQKQLGRNVEAKERQHTKEALAHFRVGYVSEESFAELTRELHAKGYTRDELNRARELIWLPPGLFVYPCYNTKGRLVRINTKLFYRSCMGGEERHDRCNHYTYDLSKEAMKEHEQKTGHKMSPNGFSRGPKTALFGSSRDIRARSKFETLILVEGENDAISIWEALQGTTHAKSTMVQAIGGNIGEDMLEHEDLAYLKKFKRIVEAFDHDEKGISYREMFNRFFTDIPYYTIKFGEDDLDGLDIDDYLKTTMLDERERYDLFENVIPILPDDNIVHIELADNTHTANYSPKHVWICKNRKGMLRFAVTQLKGRSGSQQLIGDIEIYKGSESLTPVEFKQSKSLENVRPGADHTLKTLKYHLTKHLQRFYEEFPQDEDEQSIRPDEELLMAYPFSKFRNALNRFLARRLLQAQDASAQVADALIAQYKAAIGGSAFEAVRAEMTSILNSNIIVEPGKSYPMIQLSVNFDVENNHALFYYVRNIQDNDAIAAVPCLISNRKNETRLDLLKRREKTHMLLVENKYQIPSEMEVAPLRMENCSLQPEYVDQWRNDKIAEDDISPFRIVEEIREIIEEVYYFRDPNVYRVLALWIYGTYYYPMYDAYPYIELTGRKGSGKSTLDTILTALAINARMSASATPAAIYRMLNLTGGTLVLDEMESIADKGKNDQGDIGAILKAGYTKSSGSVFRMDMDTKESVGYAVYSPKVISSINGMDDVLRDRSILITTHPAPDDMKNVLVNVGAFGSGLRLRQVHSLTSRCAISAMTHFQDVARIYEEIRTSNGANRLNQIMIPLQTMAEMCGEAYEDALTSYYESEIKASKQFVFENTLEGKMKSVLRHVALELVGLETTVNGFTSKFVDSAGDVMYNAEITYDEKNKTVSLTALHLKFLIESMSDVTFGIDEISRQARLLLGTQARAQERSKRTSTVVKNETLSRMLNGRARIHFNRYTFDLDECLDASDMERYKEHQLNRLQDKEAPF